MGSRVGEVVPGSGGLRTATSLDKVGAETMREVAPLEERKGRAREDHLHQLSINSTFYREKGNRAFKKRKYDVAYEFYTKGIRHQPTSKLFCNRSIASLRRGNLHDAFVDASLAMKLQPSNVKAYVRRAAALQKLGKLKEAAEDLEKACSLGTASDGFALKMLEDVRLCLARVEGLSDEGAAAKQAPASPPRASEGAEDSMHLLEEALCALDAVGTAPSSERATEAEAASGAKRVRQNLKQLEVLLGGEEKCVDYFFSRSGVSKVFDAFAFDNLMVLRIVSQISGAGSHAETLSSETAKRAHRIMFLNETSIAHLKIVMECVLKRRVTLVGTALDILHVMMERREFREHFLEGSVADVMLPTTLAMFAKASESLSEKCGAVIMRIAHMKKFVNFAVQHYQHFTRGLVRCCMSSEGWPKAIALAILQKVQHSKAILAMLSGRDLGLGISNILQEAVSSQSQGEQMFVSAAYNTEQLEQLGDILDICTSLCIPRRSPSGQSVSKEFVTELSDKGVWAIVVMMIESHSHKLKGAAITLFVSACKCMPELSFSVAKDKDAFQTFFDIFTNSADPKRQEEVSYVANILSNVPEFHHFISTRCPLGNLLKIVQGQTSDLAVVALCRILLCVSKNDEEFRDKLCSDIDLLRILVELWYGRKATAKFYVLQLLQLLLSEEKASKLLTESASEGQVVALVEDLAKHKVMAEAYETGGASLFSPPVENDMIVMEKSRLVDQLDIEKLCVYLGTLVRPGDEENIVVELCAASGRMLGSRHLCAQIAQKMQRSSIYAVDWVKSLVDQVASQTSRENVYTVLCDYETVDQLPVSANLTLIAGVWQSLEDPPQLFQSIRSKLRVDGKVVLMERDKECLEDAKHWAKKSGFTMFAEPTVPGCSVCVFSP
ncbi:hypothetical protein HOP50_04g34410 [Chloropicon primus]|uniref:Uncharacterized protein n=1 Tax=Chloropicon primus TaxID=1764295 RepID=A0A5B8MKD6_9CHLO|nr:hypothetical protein A3770_04p34350 [Chloropicon primus]UPR00127.1 hypothetical protein HOP50_04g34410 [Chloropicon primus]|eukprot:QDZ20917.1 hypothetical protein A3770_04p34350 [Chloropicon primus]